MKRLTTLAGTIALAAALAIAGPAAAKPAGPKANNIAAKQCQAEKQADRAAFTATYGPKRTMRECKRAHRADARDVLRNASQECRAERDADPAAFAETYATNANGKNAFGKCVSQKAHEAIDDEQPVEDEAEQDVDDEEAIDEDEADDADDANDDDEFDDEEL